MRILQVFAATFLFFVSLPAVMKMPVVPSMSLLVAAGLLMAAAASASFSWATLAAGALGVFVGTWVGDIFGAACLGGLVYAERTTRVPGRATKILHLAMGMGGFAIGMYLAGTYRHDGIWSYVPALGLGSGLASTPTFFFAEEHWVVRLRAAAKQLHAPLSMRLLLVTTLMQEEENMPQGLRKDMVQARKALLRLANLRASLDNHSSPQSLPMKESLERRILEYVDSIEEAFLVSQECSLGEVLRRDEGLERIMMTGAAMREADDSIYRDKLRSSVLPVQKST